MLPSRPRFLPLFLIVLLAAGVRFWNLGDLPTGLHGDEGIVGYEARRILQTGSIGPYSRASNGQPSGPIYLVAPSLALLGNEIVTVRLVSALVGTLTVLGLWALIRRFADEKTALVGAFILAFLLWHIHYARIAFPLESWPLVCVFIAYTTLLALEKPGAGWWILAGIVNGFGVYIYKAHPIFFLLAAGFSTVSLLFSNLGWGRKTAFLALYGGAALLSSSVLIRYALDPANDYGGQFALYSTFNRPEWQAISGFGARFLYLSGRYFGFWHDALFATPMSDYVDASGLVPLISGPVFALALVGVCWWRRRDPLTQFSRLVVIAMPLSNVVTVEAFARRTFALAPFLCVLAAVGAIQIVRCARAINPAAGKIAGFGVALSLIWALGSTLRLYFGDFAKNPAQSWVFCDELTRAVEYMKTVPKARPIYFYSERWSVTYDTRKFLAPDLDALDRSTEFGPQTAGFAPLSKREKPIWVLVGAYKMQLPTLQRDFPGGRAIEGPFSLSAQGPAFLAYESAK